MLRSVYSRLASIPALFLLLQASGSTQVSLRDRVLGPIDPTQVAAVRGSAHPLARPEFDRGRLSPSQPLSHLSVTFRLSRAQQADLDQLLREQQNPTSPRYHQWLTPEQYAQRFGMTQGDIGKVSAWLESQGLTVDGPSRNHSEIFFSGSVGQIEYALKTELHNYAVRGEQHFANATDIALPTAFSSEVLGVRGLNNFYPRPRLRQVSPRFTSNISGNHFLQPGDFATIYDLQSSYTAGINGTGQTIAVIGQTLISTTDITAFRTAANLPALTQSNFQQILAPGTGTASTCSGDEGEADLDLEWSEGVAPNVTIKYIYAGLGSGSTCATRTTDVFDALHYAVISNVAPIISISYGNCESALGSFVLTMQQWAQQANAQGQTISGPAGDSGAADCDTSGPATHGLAVDVPASIPEVTGVGGSEFTGDVRACPSTGCGTPPCAPADLPYWNGSCLTNSGPTAVEYIPEMGWNDSAQSTLSASGGGASRIFGKPSWQTGVGVPNDGARDVPDIALNASPAHDPYLMCSQGSCTNGFRDANNQLTAVGGTSAGAPTFAGILALVSQATSSSGLGNVNPMLYNLAASSGSAFHDITTGNNMVPCGAGSSNCGSSGQIGFSAGTGYDQVTGLGSLDVGKLISAWKTATPSPDFSIDGLTSTVSAAGQSGTSTVTLTGLNGFTGTVNLSCTISSTTARIGCTPNPASVAFSSTSGKTATSTLTLTTVALAHPQKPWSPWFALSGGVLAAVVLNISPGQRRRGKFAGLTVLLLILGGMGCGGSGGRQQQNQGTPTGRYIVTVTGTSGNLSHSTNLSFTVQ